MNGQLKSSEENATQLRDEIEKLRRDLKRAESIESDLKRTVDMKTRENSELQSAKDQVQNMKFL